MSKGDWRWVVRPWILKKKKHLGEVLFLISFCLPLCWNCVWMGVPFPWWALRAIPETLVTQHKLSSCGVASPGPVGRGAVPGAAPAVFLLQCPAQPGTARRLTDFPQDSLMLAAAACERSCSQITRGGKAEEWGEPAGWKLALLCFWPSVIVRTECCYVNTSWFNRDKYQYRQLYTPVA